MISVECEDVINQYTNPELVFQGGQRVVYKVLHPEYGTVIVKIGRYKTTDSQDGWEIERIEREIGLLKQIDSIYYPKNFSFEIISDFRYVIVEEFIESTSLANCMDGFQNPVEIVDLIKDLILGLKVIWDMNVVHRDLKPDNILITPSGLPKIIDLGIARSLDSKSITKTIFGGPCSLDYAAPELLKYNKKLIDFRTDQYNLGIILVQLLLEGTHPFDPKLVGGNSIPQNILADNWFREVFDNGDLIPIRSVVLKLLGYQPYQRFRTHEMLMREIESCAGCLYEV